jgi:dCMP deaminase
MTGKREEYISWDGYFMGLAAEASFRSKDPSTQNGCCIVDTKTNIPLSLGYNGFPNGCSDDKFPWDRKAEKKYYTKYPYVEHAERNAIYNAAKKGVPLDGATIYIHSEKGYYPCAECARAIIQSGIRKVVMGFAIKESTDVYNWDETLRMFEAADVWVEVLNSSPAGREKIVRDFKIMNKKMEEIVVKLEEK